MGYSSVGWVTGGVILIADDIFDGRYNRIYGHQRKPAKFIHVHQVPILLRQRGYSPHVLAVLQKVSFLECRHGTTATNQEETITTGPVTPLKENREMVEGKVEQRMEKAP